MATTNQVSGHPVRVEIDYPAELSRLLIFVKWLLVIPNAIVLAVYGYAALAAMFIAWWVILVTGHLPRGLFEFILGYQRWSLRTSAYVLLLTDEYPPFSGEDDQSHPVRMTCEYPESLSRGLVLIKWLLIIPHLFVLYLYGAALYLVLFFACVAILISGSFPRGLFDFAAGYFRWQGRVAGYFSLLTDEYPPFSNE